MGPGLRLEFIPIEIGAGVTDFGVLTGLSFKKTENSTELKIF